MKVIINTIGTCPACNGKGEYHIEISPMRDDKEPRKIGPFPCDMCEGTGATVKDSEVIA